MKLIFRSAAIAALLIATSCGKDTADAIADLFEDQEQMETMAIDVSVVTDNVVIQGGTKMEGELPAANGVISLDISNAGKTAFLNEGFNIPVSSDGAITGAYIQFKSEDGTLADSYYDIDIATNASNKKGPKLNRRSKLGALVSKTEDDASIDVDFNSTIEPGTFCYTICVYDEEGNISLPSDVCVTVESWGGNADLIARWEMVKEEITDEGETSVIEIGDPFCDEWTASCGEDSSFEVSVCYVQEYGILEFKADGTYSIDFKGEDDNYNEDASFQECQAVFDTKTVYRYQSNGNWAYAASEKRLTLVEYNYTIDEDGEVETETVESGDAELVFDGIIELDGSSLVIVEDDGNDDSKYKVFFTK